MRKKLNPLSTPDLHELERAELLARSAGGESSSAEIAFFYRKLRERRVGSVVIGALTDYNPWGYEIASNFRDKLASAYLFGPDKVELVRFTGSQPDLLELLRPEQIESGKRGLTHYHQYKQTQVAAWMRITQGINGEPYGLHIDLASELKMFRRVEKWVKDLNRK